MAKKSKIAKNEQRRAIVERYAERRAELKEIIRSPASSPEQRVAAQSELNRQPRDASAVRLRNRDAVDGRPRGYLRKFGLSRVRVRELVHDGVIARRAESELVMAPKTPRNRRAKLVDTKPAKPNLFAKLGVSSVDYKDTNTLRMFLSERGKIRSRRVTGLTVQQQRQVANAIKNAREMALLPYA